MPRKKIEIPADYPRIEAISAIARRERVKQYILAGKMRVHDMAEEEGVNIGVIRSDIRHLKNQDILKEAKEATRLAFLDYSEEIDWAVSEARRLHEEKIDEETKKGGRLDCLTFVARTKKEEIEMAQKLGLLDLIGEKQEHTVKFDPTNSDLIKKFGDFIASEK